MESANLGHQHQLQEQPGGSSSLVVPSFNGVGSSHLWNQSLLLNCSNFNSNFNGVISNSKDLRQSNKIQVHSSINTCMSQDLGFHWTGEENNSNHSTNELQIAKIKAGLSDSFPKFGDPSTFEELHLHSTSNIKQEQQYLQAVNEKHLLKSLSSGCQINGIHLSSADFISDPHSCCSLGVSRILPSTHSSTLNPLSSFSNSMGMNLQALNLLASNKMGMDFSQPLLNNLASFEGVPFDLHHLQESSECPSNSCQKISFMNGTIETKTGIDHSETEASQPLPKRPRFESRSIPPFKVRKEKLGDRIAALQQLVAPFGKTDTASVLLEAIGYIKFLQEQVETLSVPYLKNGACTMSQWNIQGSEDEDNSEEPKRDLRSKGLCLVPLSCTSYVTNDNGSVWSPPNFRGGT